MRAILWDMDGTLVDSEPLHEHALVEALGRVGLPVAPDLHAQVLGMSADAVYGWLCREAGLSLPFHEWVAIKYAIYGDGIARVKPFTEAVATWHAADAAGLRQAVASNSDRIIVEANLGHVGLIRPGLVTVSRNDIRKGKPDPEIYLRAAWLLGVAPQDAVVVEDSGTGAAAGLAAGMRVFMVPHTDAPVPPGAEKLADFAALRALFPDG